MNGSLKIRTALDHPSVPASRYLEAPLHALVEIEPPGNFRGRAIFEIDDCVLIAGEVSVVEKRASAVQQTQVCKLDLVANTLAVEAGKEGGGAGSVKALVVIENANVHSDSSIFSPPQG